MLMASSLQSFYFQKIGKNCDSFEKIMEHFLQNTPIEIENILEECEWKETLLSEQKTVENWKRLLTLNIMSHSHQLDSAQISARVRAFEGHSWNQSSQYMRSLVAVNHAFAKMPIPEVAPHLLESGAILLNFHEYSPWQSLPYHPFIFEFGIFLSLLSLLTKREDLKGVVKQLTTWQLNMLDGTGEPFKGLFTREEEGSHLENLCSSYLLFKSAAIVCEDNFFATISAILLKKIEKDYVESQEVISPLWVVIEKWLDQFKIPSEESLNLPENIYDPSTALIGNRSVSHHAMCTLHGEHTGLGSFRQGDVEILNYGPQHLPLSECQGFGIEGNILSDHGMRRSIMESKRSSFMLKGCVRLVDTPRFSSAGMEAFRGIWLEVVQEYKRPHLYLKTHFLGLDGWDKVAFSFFVKANQCHVSSKKTLYPKTLERYVGKVETLRFESAESSVELRDLSCEGEMHVIPLAGGESFWGADFLVAYLLSSQQSDYQWVMTALSSGIKD